MLLHAIGIGAIVHPVLVEDRAFDRMDVVIGDRFGLVLTGAIVDHKLFPRRVARIKVI